MNRNKDTQWTYAWDWFALHAGQRLEVLNFWLVAMAFLAAAFVQAAASKMHSVAAGVSLLGALSSVAFRRLDARIRYLQHIGEDALRVLESELTANATVPEMALISRSNEKRSGWFDTYRTIIQGLQAVTGILFLFAFVYSLVSWLP